MLASQLVPGGRKGLADKVYHSLAAPVLQSPRETESGFLELWQTSWTHPPGCGKKPQSERQTSGPEASGRK